jgi:hypothetical protein
VQFVQLRNRFRARADEAGRGWMAQFENVEIIADWMDVWLENRLDNRFT